MYIQELDNLTNLDEKTRKLLESPLVQKYFLAMDNEFYLNFGDDPFALSLVSAIAGEGKTTLALLFGIFSAILSPENKILLVDSSKNSDLSRQLGATNRSLVEYCSSQKEGYELLHNSGLPNLDVLRVMPFRDGFNKFPHVALSAAVSDLRKTHRRIFIDTSSGYLIKDDVSVSKMARDVLIVIKYRASMQQQVNVLADELRLADCNILGTTLNRRIFSVPKFLYGK